VPVPVLNEGVSGALIVYVADDTALDTPAAMAIAFSVAVLPSGTGPEYLAEAEPGVVPSVV
jgi:hypothetical protein